MQNQPPLKPVTIFCCISAASLAVAVAIGLALLAQHFGVIHASDGTFFLARFVGVFMAFDATMLGFIAKETRLGFRLMIAGAIVALALLAALVVSFTAVKPEQPRANVAPAIQWARGTG